MSKKKKQKRTRPSEETSHRAEASAPPVSSGTPPPSQSFWRALAGEPVAIGVAIFVLLRPWSDGLTFVSFNVYYVAWILVLGALWGVRTLLRNEPLRFGVPMGLLAAYCGVSYLAGAVGYEHFLAQRSLQYLTSYALLFFVCSNALRTRLAIGIVLTAFLGVVFLNATWAAIHYFQTLPFMREVLLGNSDVLYSYFGVRQLTPELQHRLEMNRAFGTFLFPNALAAFLLLAIPYLLSELWVSWRGRRELFAGLQEEDAPGLSGPEAYRRGWLALGVGGAIALVVSFCLILLNDRLGAMNGSSGRPIEGLFLQLVFFGMMPIGLGVGSGFLLRSRGLSSFGRLFGVVAVAVTLPVALYALWLSYSRGAMIVLLVASAISMVLFVLGGRAQRSLGVVPRSIIAVLILLGLSRAIVSSPAVAQELVEPELIPTPIALFGVDEDEFGALSIEGRGRTIGDLSDIGSFGLRVTYWQVSLLMLADNLWTGVGPGCFKVAYASYQFIDAGDVEAAHNDFLQAFCETGLVGGSLFLAFWIYFVVWGGRRILRESDVSQRALLAGLYAGVLAFLLHSALEFNFTNPALASLVYILAAVFYARARAFEESDVVPKSETVRVGRLVAVPVLIVVVFLASSVLRMFLFELSLTDGTRAHRFWNVGDRKPFQQYVDIAQFFTVDLKKREQDAQGAPYTFFSSASLLIPDRGVLESFGVVRIRVPGNPPSLRSPRPDEVVPNNAYLFITDIPRARSAAIKAIEERVAFLKGSDELYPYDPELAAHIYSWYEILFSSVENPENKKRYAQAGLEWARKSMERGPEVAWFHIYYAKALWLRGSVETGQRALDYYTEGIEEYETAYELYPVTALFASQYGRALLKLGKAYVDSGRVEAGEDMRTRGEELVKLGVSIDRYRGLGR